MTEAQISAALDGTFTRLTRSYEFETVKVARDFLPSHQPRSRVGFSPEDMEGWASLKPRWRRISAEERATIMTMHAEGKTKREIASAIGRLCNTIDKVIRKEERRKCGCFG